MMSTPITPTPLLDDDEYEKFGRQIENDLKKPTKPGTNTKDV